MKRAHILFSLVTVALAAGVIYLLYELHSSRELNSRLQIRAETVDKAQAALLAPSQDLLATLNKAELSTGPITKVHAAAQEATVTSVSPQSAAVFREMLASPEIQERSRKLNRAMLPSRYPDIGEVLNLSPDEVNRLFDLLAEQQADTMREISAGSSSGENSAQIMARRSQANEAEVASVLGSKYPQWQEYRGEAPTRVQVKELNTVLNESDTPLSDDQARSLIPALIAAQKRMMQDSVGPGTPDHNRRILEAAAPYLMPQQLSAYQKMLERQGSMGALLIR